MSVSYLTPGMSFECDSWGFTAQGQAVVKKQTPATNWTMYMIHFIRYARGFDFETYKEGYGIKKIKVSSQYIYEDVQVGLRMKKIFREDTLWGLVPREKKR